jgi:predicted XRE-type DNA-binding protein
MMRKPQTRTVAVERGSGNVFADIGPPDAEMHLAKITLVSHIDDIIRHRRLTPAKAAAVMGLKQPDLPRLLSGDFRDFSVERLLRLLTAVDRDIDIVIRRKPARARRPGRLQVVAATAVPVSRGAAGLNRVVSYSDPDISGR